MYTFIHLTVMCCHNQNYFNTVRKTFPLRHYNQGVGIGPVIKTSERSISLRAFRQFWHLGVNESNLGVVYHI